MRQLVWALVIVCVCPIDARLTEAAPGPPVSGKPASGSALTPSSDTQLEAGVTQVLEGDFENATRSLLGAVNRLSARTGTEPDLARAFLYLGIASVGMDQLEPAKAYFREALGKDPTLALTADRFPPKVIRTFDAVRQQLAGRTTPATTLAAQPSTPAPSPVTTTPAKRAEAAPPQPSPAKAAEPKEKKKGGSKGLLIGLGVAAAAGGGVAIAVGGGGGGGSSQAPQSPPSSGVAATTPTTTTTTPPSAANTPPSLSFRVTPSSPNGQPPLTVAVDMCASRDPDGDTLHFRIEWGEGSPQTSGCAGSHTYRNPGTFRIHGCVNDGRSSDRCDSLNAHIQEEPPPPSSPPPGPYGVGASKRLTWVSDLAVKGGRAQIVVDGTQAFYPGEGRGHWVIELRHEISWMNEVRVEAQLVVSEGKPGTWRFEGPINVGTLQVIAGDVISATSSAITFRMSGKPGERIAFSFRPL